MRSLPLERGFYGQIMDADRWCRSLRQLETARFGTLEVAEEDVVHFPLGIPAFEDHREWVFVGEDESPVKWLQSLADGDVALPVCPPGFVRGDYNARIPAEELEVLECAGKEDMALFLVLSIPASSPWDMTANLRAPIVLNHVKRLGTQVIAANEDYGVRHPVFPPEARARFGGTAAEEPAPAGRSGALHPVVDDEEEGA